MNKTEKDILAIGVIIYLIVVTYSIVTYRPTTAPFTDTVGHLLVDDIEAMHQEGLTSGCGDGLFCPDDLLTKVDASVFALRLEYGADYQPQEAVGLFDDMPLDHWGTKWAEAAYTAGLMPGCDDGFCPDDGISRAVGAMLIGVR